MIIELGQWFKYNSTGNRVGSYGHDGEILRRRTIDKDWIEEYVDLHPPIIIKDHMYEGTYGW